MDGMIDVETHLEHVLAAVRATAVERVTAAGAHGRVLAAPAVAATSIPAFANSSMDGFAVRSADVGAAPPVTLRVIADLPAGSADDPAIGPGEAVRIMTGAPVPTDADAIVPFEDTVDGLDDSLETCRVLRAPAAGAFVRRAGSDLVAGAEVLAAGQVLGALQLGALAAAGIAQVDVHARPRVAVISTGSELIEPGRVPTRGQVPDSNGALLSTLAVECGAEVVLTTRVDDAGEGLRTAVQAAREQRADAVVFSGGVSAGAYEVVKLELADRMRFSKVAMQPGKPQGFGTWDGMLLFGLPGNPVSAAVSFDVFVRPALAAMQGRDAPLPSLQLTAAEGWRTPPGRRQYLPVRIDRTDDSGWLVRPATAGGSHLAGGLGLAQAWAIVPADIDEVAAGDTVTVALRPGADGMLES